MSKKLSDILEKTKAAIYIRVSTSYQIDKDSLPLQREDLINYAKYALSITDFEVFEDAGYSAKNTDRPAYQRMMARLRSGEFSHVMVWKIDRISRNLLDFATMYQEFKDLGVTFISKNEQFDTSSAMGEAMLKIILVFAELERNMTSERVSAVMMSRATDGKWNGGKVPFGYSYDKETKTFSINPDEAAIVETIYAEYERIHSTTRLSAFLNESGIHARSGRNWSPVTICHILKSPFYTGTYRYNYRDESKGLKLWSIKDEKEWITIDDHHPAIIDRDRWAASCAQLQKNNRKSDMGGKTYFRKNVHIFAGLLTCGYCGSNMIASTSRERSDGWRPSTYSCSRKRRFTDCPNKYISDIAIGQFVLNYIANMMKAQKSFGVSTSIETLEKKLLRGASLSGVKSIEHAGLLELYNHFKGIINGEDEYAPINAERGEDADEQERDTLLTEKRRKERALDRLQSLYLFGDDSIPERDYIIERKKLLDSVSSIDARLEAIEKNLSSAFTLSDNEFVAKASYFIMAEKLSGKRYVDYEKYLLSIDPLTLKDFINSICQNFCIKNGKVVAIRFKNGIEHKFLYSDDD